MTLLAVARELGAMLVRVTVQAIARQPQVGPHRVLHDELAPRRIAHVLGSVAFPAIKAAVAALQVVAGLGVIELREIDIPADRHEFHAVVFGMATDALQLAAVLLGHGGVQSAFLADPLANLGMTAQAFEFAGSGSERVAGGALRLPGEALVRLRQGTGRELRLRRSRGEQHQNPSDLVEPSSQEYPRLRR